MTGGLTSVETMALIDPRQQLSQAVNLVARNERRILLETSGVLVAALVPPDHLRRLNAFETRREDDQIDEHGEPVDSC
jgi:hypothetical protein